MAKDPRDNLKPPWKPGESGNPKGRPKERPIAAALKELLARNDGEAIDALAKVALANALKGKDIRWAQEVWNRTDGKVRDTLDITTTDGETADGFAGLSDAEREAAVLEFGKEKDDATGHD